MNFLDIQPGHQTTLTTPGQPLERVHVFDRRSIDAVNAALAAARPLLVRGEPGIGKSQLAQAVARVLKRVFVSHVVDAHCESRDLLWHFDAVQRLADAQLGKAMGENPAEIREKLQVRNYIHPGPLWWAFDWQGARDHLVDTLKGSAPEPEPDPKCKSENGCVLLIDEIDKAEMDVPNGLLEALGEGKFTPMGWNHPIRMSKPPPLVIITTNEERALPNAFVRRCLVLHLKLVEDGTDLEAHLVQRGRAHFPRMADEVLKAAAKQLRQDREEAATAHHTPLPGQAEYLDLLRALHNRAEGNVETQLGLLKQIAEYVVRKQAGAGL